VRAYVGTASVRAAWWRGWRARVRAQSVEVASADAADLDAAVERLDAALAQLAARGARIAGAACEIVLADAWLLYDVVEADLRDAPARIADETIRAALADVAGVDPAALEVRWQAQAANLYGACALPASALRALAQVCARRRLRLRSVTGELAHVFNARRAQIAAGSPHWLLAVVQPSGVQFGLWRAGRLEATYFDNAPPDDTTLQRDARALLRRVGLEGDSIRCYAAGAGGMALPAGWTALAAG
jgi:hypothetical protein